MKNCLEQGEPWCNPRSSGTRHFDFSSSAHARRNHLAAPPSLSAFFPRISSKIQSFQSFQWLAPQSVVRFVSISLPFSVYLGIVDSFCWLFVFFFFRKKKLKLWWIWILGFDTRRIMYLDYARLLMAFFCSSVLIVGWMIRATVRWNRGEGGRDSCGNWLLGCRLDTRVLDY